MPERPHESIPPEIVEAADALAESQEHVAAEERARSSHIEACDAAGCELPCDLLELVGIADCDLGCF